MKKILITGGSGFVGTHISRALLAAGHFVTGIGRSSLHPKLRLGERFEWICADTSQKGPWQERVGCADIIINLAGHNIFRFWTKKTRRAIYNSRVLTTGHIVDAIENGRNQRLLTTSAVGIYGHCDDEVITEEKAPGHGFLSRVCMDWEAQGLKAKTKGAGVCVMRFGVVLGPHGALAKMMPAFKMFAGGPIGSGRQWFPWIHIKDIEKAVQFLIEHTDLEGIFNFTAPEPVRQKEMAKALGRVLKRPAFLPVPGFIVKTLLGELGAAFLESQRALPRHLENAGYDFLFPRLDAALQDILEK
jgi:hypothetical protein